MTVETTLLIDEEDLHGVNTENTKNVLLLILDDLINVNEESELEEEIEMLKRWK
ncbi:hypothetical protein CWI36_0512p0010 [Hamiltosporidium magnivora]|uniref:Uncharacterized protein n=1 Tax=Hamiltosporidium magnivora TaxID=148818 RepID=A0A4Q9LDV7_9MICR|nr:hypothetical protein CWI36_0512p0010 [Hamiltosporidium magnivora]